MEARIFKSVDSEGKEVTLRFKPLTQVVVGKGDFVFRENFSKAIRAGFMTNAEAVKLLTERKIWTEKEDEELLDIRAQILMLEDQIQDLEDEDSGLEVYNKIKELRSRQSLLTSTKSSVLSNTAESAASEYRTQFYASECVVYDSSGKKVFMDLKDFMSRVDEQIALDSYKQAYLVNWSYVSGLPVPTSKDLPLPEDEWAEKIAEKKVKEKVEPAKKKRRGRKKKTQSS